MTTDLAINRKVDDQITFDSILHPRMTKNINHSDNYKRCIIFLRFHS